MAGVCDFVLLIDATASMKPCISALVENLNIFVDNLTSGQWPVYDWRGRAVGYRDATHDGDQWFVDNPFVKDGEALKAQLRRLEAKGGGHLPESLLDALYKVVKGNGESAQQSDSDFNWRDRHEATRVVIAFTDAIYHEKMSDKIPDAAGGTWEDLIPLFAGTKVYLYLFAPDEPLYENVSQFQRVNWEAIPGPDYQKGMRDYTQNQDNFSKVMAALAASVSKSAAVEPV